MPCIRQLDHCACMLPALLHQLRADGIKDAQASAPEAAGHLWLARVTGNAAPGKFRRGRHHKIAFSGLSKNHQHKGR